jgi:hypothetical protein
MGVVREPRAEVTPYRRDEDSSEERPKPPVRTTGVTNSGRPARSSETTANHGVQVSTNVTQTDVTKRCRRTSARREGTETWNLPPDDRVVSTQSEQASIGRYDYARKRCTAPW